MSEEYVTQLYHLDKVPGEWLGKSGVYILKNTKTQKEYVGSSSNLKKRIDAHIGKSKWSSTTNNANKELLEDMKKYVFKVGVLKFCENYLEEEAIYINKHFGNLYNVMRPKDTPQLSASQKAVFISKYVVDEESGCWLWIGKKNKAGYGTFSISGTYMAHRISYCNYHGSCGNHLLLRHQCGHKDCVNPEHLILGTGSQNWDDWRDAGNNKNGITWEIVRSIREDWNSGLYNRGQLKKKYGFDVRHIIRNQAWIDPTYMRLIKGDKTAPQYRTSNDVKEIRAMWLTGRYTMKMMNAKYGGDVSEICYNRSWIDPTYIVPIKKKRKEGDVQANIAP